MAAIFPTRITKDRFAKYTELVEAQDKVLELSKKLGLSSKNPPSMDPDFRKNSGRGMGPRWNSRIHSTTNQKPFFFLFFSSEIR